MKKRTMNENYITQEAWKFTLYTVDWDCFPISEDTAKSMWFEDQGLFLSKLERDIILDVYMAYKEHQKVSNESMDAFVLEMINKSKR